MVLVVLRGVGGSMNFVLYSNLIPRGPLCRAVLRTSRNLPCNCSALLRKLKLTSPPCSSPHHHRRPTAAQQNGYRRRHLELCHQNGILRRRCRPVWKDEDPTPRQRNGSHPTAPPRVPCTSSPLTIGLNHLHRYYSIRPPRSRSLSYRVQLCYPDTTKLQLTRQSPRQCRQREDATP
jgi:hypothetical protein